MNKTVQPGAADRTAPCGKNRAVLFAFMAVLSFFVSCTGVDNSVGSGFVPDEQQLLVRIDTISGAAIKAYLAQYDSFPTKDLDVGFIGSRRSDVFGLQQAGFATQFSWIGGSSEGKLNFENSPAPDSLVMYIYFSSYAGNADVTRTIDIYLLNKRLHKKTENYYSTYDIEQAIDRNDKFFSFEYTGKAIGDVDSLSVTLTGPKAEQFMAALLDDSGDVYVNDSLFMDRFNGFYFENSPSSPEEASIAAFDIATSSLALYYHNHTDASATAVKDTLALLYVFYNHEDSPITSLNTFRYDYTGTGIQNINDTLSTSTPVSVGYVQGFGGVTTYLRFMPEFIDELKSKIVSPYTKMAINRAELNIPANNSTPENLNTALLRMGAYDDYKIFTGIPDYPYALESSYQIQLQYDGYLSRTHSCYIMDISHYLQRAINSADAGRDYRMILGPAYNELWAYRQSELKTEYNPITGDDPLKVAITYTLLK